jgi:uncharacterized delta-60 repeat protein
MEISIDLRLPCTRETNWCLSMRVFIQSVGLLFASAAYLTRAHATIPEGSFDPNWAGSGRISFPGDFFDPGLGSSLTFLSVQSDGNLLLGGFVNGPGVYWWIGELTSAGQFVQTFGASDGTGRYNGCEAGCSTFPGGAVGVLPQAGNGYAVLSSSAYSYQTFSPTVANVYGNQLTINNVAGFVLAGSAIAQQPDGKLLLAGQGQYNETTQTQRIFGVVRTDLNENLDASFNNTTDGNNVTFSGGTLITVSAADEVEYATSILLQSDGKIVLVGAGFNGATRFEAVRLNADGTLDTSFGNGGTTVLDWGQGIITSTGNAKFDSAGRILVAGGGTFEPLGIGGMLVVRLNADGSPDDTFGTGGIAFNNYSSQCESTSASDVVEDSAGRILAVGTCQQSSGNVFIVARLRGDTSAVDPSFGFNGYGLGVFAGTTSVANTVTLDAGSRPIVGGFANPDAGVARLTYDLIFTNGMESLPPGCLSPNCN